MWPSLGGLEHVEQQQGSSGGPGALPIATPPKTPKPRWMYYLPGSAAPSWRPKAKEPLVEDFCKGPREVDRSFSRSKPNSSCIRKVKIDGESYHFPDVFMSIWLCECPYLILTCIRGHMQLPRSDAHILPLIGGPPGVEAFFTLVLGRG